MATARHRRADLAGLAAASGQSWALPHYMEVLLADHDHERILDTVRRHDPVDAVAEFSAHVAALYSTKFVWYPDGES